MIVRALTQVLVLLCSLLGSSLAYAQVPPLPSSTAPGMFWRWEHSQPLTFAGLEEAYRACLEVAGRDLHPRFTPAICERFVRQMQGGGCQVVAVPNGTRFDYMLFRRDGRNYAQPRVEQRLRPASAVQPARLCELGDGVSMYFFDNRLGGHGCNNPAVVFGPPVIASSPACRMVCGGQTVTTDSGFILPSTVFRSSCGCYVPVPGLSLPGGNTIQGRTCYQVCD